MKRALWCGGAVAVVAVAIAAYAMGPGDAGPASPTFAAEAPRTERIAVPDVEVTAADGQTRRFRQEVAADNLLVITFNYTTCATICPVGGVVMKAVDERTAELRRPVRLLSITIDPATDTPRKLRAAAAEAGASPDWLWLTGRPAEIDRLLATFGARAAEIQLHDPVFLIGDGATGEFRRIVGLPEPDRVVQALKSFDR